jgi:hypothetical protein
MGYLNEGRKGFMGGLSKIFGNNDNAVASPGEAAAKADMYICVNASTVELPDIERYVAEYVGDKPIVLWNLELDTLRADLGAACTYLSSLLDAGFCSPLLHVCSSMHPFTKLKRCLLACQP